MTRLEQLHSELSKVWRERSICCDGYRLRFLDREVRRISEEIVRINTAEVTR